MINFCSFSFESHTVSQLKCGVSSGLAELVVGVSLSADQAAAVGLSQWCRGMCQRHGKVDLGLEGSEKMKIYQMESICTPPVHLLACQTACAPLQSAFCESDRIQRRSKCLL